MSRSFAARFRLPRPAPDRLRRVGQEPDAVIDADPGDHRERGRRSSTPTAARRASDPGTQTRDTLEAPTEELDPRETYVATVKTNCGTFEITLDAKRAPKTGGSFKYLADQELLQRPADPPDRPRLRLPGRRSRGQRLGRPRLHGRRGAAQGPQIRQVRRRDGQDRRRPAGHVRLAVLRRHRRRRRASSRPTTRCWARSRAGQDGRRQDRRDHHRPAHGLPGRAGADQVDQRRRDARPRFQIPPASVGHDLERELEALGRRRRRPGRAGSPRGARRRRCAAARRRSPLEQSALAPSATATGLPSG